MFLGSGHLDSKTSIRHVLLATSCISLVFSISQGALEFVSPDESFHVIGKDYELFGHGGMVFWFISSIVFTAVSVRLIQPASEKDSANEFYFIL